MPQFKKSTNVNKYGSAMTDANAKEINKMIKNKRSILWMLMIGIFCMPIKQARADTFFRDDQSPLRERQLFVAMAVLAAASFYYAVYSMQDENEVDESEQDDLDDTHDNESEAWIDISSLDISSEAAVSLIVTCIAAYFMYECDDLAREKENSEKKFLNSDAESRWKQENRLEIYSIVTPDKAIELLDIKLKQIKKTSSVKIPLIARLTKNYSYHKLVELINSAGKLAIRRGDGVLDMSHINMVQESIDFGYQDTDVPMNIAKTAVHEAGHAVTAIYKHNKYIVHQATVIPRRDERPIYYDAKSLDFRYRYVRYRLGSIMWINSSDVTDALTESEHMNNVMIFLAGGVAEQVILRSHNGHKDKKSLDDLLSRPGVASDIEQARAHALEVARLRCKNDNLSYNQLAKIQDEVIAECYEKTFEFIMTEKENVKNVARLLKSKGTVPGSDIYKLLDKPEPKYDFELDQQKSK